MAEPDDERADALDEDADAGVADDDREPASGGTAAAEEERPGEGATEAGGEGVPERTADGDEELSREELRERVEETYDFDDFGPSDMAEMSAEEWEAAFEDGAWVTGEDLLDRVEADLRSRIADRDVFAVVERIAGDRPRVVAYSDEGYAVVDAAGSIEGRGTVLRDVKPTVALASMPEYEVPEPPEDAGLPRAEEVPDAGGDVGNLVLQFVAVVLGLAGLALLGASVFSEVAAGSLVAVVVGVAFLGTAVFLGVVVANARLSARFRAEEYRERLRRAGVAEDERPDFLPIDEREFDDQG